MEKEKKKLIALIAKGLAMLHVIGAMGMEHYNVVIVRDMVRLDALAVMVQVIMEYVYIVEALDTTNILDVFIAKEQGYLTA